MKGLTVQMGSERACSLYPMFDWGPPTMSLGVAFKAFFAAISNRKTSDRIRLALSGEPIAPRLPEQPPEPIQAAKPLVAARSDAITLLSTLQREARLLDLVQESLDGFNDAQIGAAAREVLRDSRKCLDRMFAIEPLAEADEGAVCQVQSNPSPARFRLVGKSEGNSGTIAHRGWKATRCEIPKWNGSPQESLILAPIEIDVA